MKLFMSLLLISSFSWAQAQMGGYLKPEQQKYYKNDSFEGKNQRERIDSLVVELNKVYGELESMKAEMKVLKKEVEDLKVLKK